MKDIYFSLMLSWSEPQEKIVQDAAESCLADFGQRRASHENTGYQ